jgi:hypothetical protein
MSGSAVIARSAAHAPAADFETLNQSFVAPIRVRTSERPAATVATRMTMTGGR